MAYFIELTKASGPFFVNIDHILSITQIENKSRLVCVGGTKDAAALTIFVEESATDIMAQIPRGMKETRD